MTKEWRKLRN